jgi:hypothetical protein
MGGEWFGGGGASVSFSSLAHVECQISIHFSPIIADLPLPQRVLDKLAEQNHASVNTYVQAYDENDSPIGGVAKTTYDGGPLLSVIMSASGPSWTILLGVSVDNEGKGFYGHAQDGTDLFTTASSSYICPSVAALSRRATQLAGEVNYYLGVASNSASFANSLLQSAGIFLPNIGVLTGWSTPIVPILPPPYAVWRIRQF